MSYCRVVCFKKDRAKGMPEFHQFSIVFWECATISHFSVILITKLKHFLSPPHQSHSDKKIVPVHFWG